jgi:hypothetical protein
MGRIEKQKRELIEESNKRVLNEGEESNIITSIDVGGEITSLPDKKNVGVLGRLGCKNCEDPNGNYSVNIIKYDKSKVDDAIGDTTKIVVYDKDQKIVHMEPHPKSKGFMINFKFSKDKLPEGQCVVVVFKDDKPITHQPTTYEPFW